MTNSSPVKLIPAAKLLLKTIKEESKNGVCTATDIKFAELMDCSEIYIAKLMAKLKNAGKIESKRVGSNGREIILIE